MSNCHKLISAIYYVQPTRQFPVRSSHGKSYLSCSSQQLLSSSASAIHLVPSHMVVFFLCVSSWPSPYCLLLPMTARSWRCHKVRHILVPGGAFSPRQMRQSSNLRICLWVVRAQPPLTAFWSLPASILKKTTFMVHMHANKLNKICPVSRPGLNGFYIC